MFIRRFNSGRQNSWQDLTGALQPLPRRGPKSRRAANAGRWVGVGGGRAECISTCVVGQSFFTFLFSFKSGPLAGMKFIVILKDVTPNQPAGPGRGRCATRPATDLAGCVPCFHYRRSCVQLTRVHSDCPLNNFLSEFAVPFQRRALCRPDAMLNWTYSC